MAWRCMAEALTEQDVLMPDPHSYVRYESSPQYVAPAPQYFTPAPAPAPAPQVHTYTHHAQPVATATVVEQRQSLPMATAVIEAAPERSATVIERRPSYTPQVQLPIASAVVQTANRPSYSPAVSIPTATAVVQFAPAPAQVIHERRPSLTALPTLPAASTGTFTALPAVAAPVVTSTVRTVSYVPPVVYSQAPAPPAQVATVRTTSYVPPVAPLPPVQTTSFTAIPQVPHAVPVATATVQCQSSPVGSIVRTNSWVPPPVPFEVPVPQTFCVRDQIGMGAVPTGATSFVQPPARPVAVETLVQPVVPQKNFMPMASCALAPPYGGPPMGGPMPSGMPHGQQAPLGSGLLPPMGVGPAAPMGPWPQQGACGFHPQGGSMQQGFMGGPPQFDPRMGAPMPGFMPPPGQQGFQGTSPLRFY